MKGGEGKDFSNSNGSRTRSTTLKTNVRASFTAETGGKKGLCKVSVGHESYCGVQLPLSFEFPQSFLKLCGVSCLLSATLAFNKEEESGQWCQQNCR